MEEILKKPFDNKFIDKDEAYYLLNNIPRKQYNSVFKSANNFNQMLNANNITYLSNNYVCYSSLTYFEKLELYSKDENMLYNYEKLKLEEIEKQIDNTEGSSEIYLTGGIYPEYSLNYCLTLLEHLKGRYKDKYIHGFSPHEIDNLAVRSNLPLEGIIKRLKDAGLKKVSGIYPFCMQDENQKQVFLTNITKEKWLEIVQMLEKAGIKISAIVLLDKVTNNEEVVRILDTLRDLQAETDSFDDFVPTLFLPYHIKSNYYNALRYSKSINEEFMLYIALARLYFGKLIKNIQVNFYSYREKNTLQALMLGANDIGGTYHDNLFYDKDEEEQKRIRKLVPQYTEEYYKKVLVRIGKKPVKRDSFYRRVE